MSRSRKKYPGGGIAVADSDKSYKEAEHRRERRHVVAALTSKIWEETGEINIPSKRFGDPWKSPKDGKQFWAEHDDKWMRK